MEILDLPERLQRSADLRLVRAVCYFGGKTYIFAGPVIFQLCPLWREIDAPGVFVRSMGSGKMSNRSKKVVTSASNDTFEVGRAQKSGAAAKVQACLPTAKATAQAAQYCAKRSTKALCRRHHIFRARSD